MTTETMTADKATALRRPFPPESVGQLPKGGQMLDYVGHAAVTDRLLTVDPDWTWEPMALAPDGLPALDSRGNLWIRLTVCGVTRIGVGDGKNAKEVIGDAIRNAAMRFGVALDLWAKENLVEFAQAAVTATRRAAAPEPTWTPDAAETGELMSARTRGHLFALFGQKGVPEADQLPGINRICGTTYDSRSELTEADAAKVIAALRLRPDQSAGASDDAASSSHVEAPGHTEGAPADDKTDAGPAEVEGEATDAGPAEDQAPVTSGDRVPPGPMRPAQRRLIMARLGELDVDTNDSEERNEILGALLGRTLESATTLTRAEAGTLIETLGPLKDRAALNAHLDELDAAR